MRQVLHIFRKDVRHHWPEIVVSLALVLAYAHYEVRSWQMPGGFVALGAGSFFDGSFWSGLLQFLLPVSWCFLVIRIIQDESLVGDRQFWVTRPYQWPKLLTSKVIFVLASVIVPLLVLQCYVLARAGFHPARYAVGLLWMQSAMLLVLIIPAAVLATVSATIAQWLLAVLFVVLYFVGWSWLGSLSRNTFSVPDMVDHLEGYLFITTCIAVILLQYSRRATVKSRLLLGSFACLAVLIGVISPYDYNLAKAYPLLPANQATPFQLTLLQPGKRDVRVLPEKGTKILVLLPLRVTGVSADAIVNMAGVQVAVDGPNRLHWESGWQPMGAQVFPETNEVQVRFMMEHDELERRQQSPASVRVALAYTVFQDKDRTPFVIPGERFELDGMACSPGRIRAETWCLVAVREPASLLLTSQLSKTTCPRVGQEPPPSDDIARAWIRNYDSSPAQFGISPVKTRSLYLGATDRAQRPPGGMGLCPGTPVMLSHPRMIGSHRAELDLGEVKLGDYRQ